MKLSNVVLALVLVVPTLLHGQTQDQAIEGVLKQFQEAKDYAARQSALRELAPLIQDHPHNKAEKILWEFSEASFEFDAQQDALKDLIKMNGLQNFQEKLETKTLVALQGGQNQSERLKAIALMKWAGYITYDFRFEGRAMGAAPEEVALAYDASSDRLSKEIELRLRNRLLILLNDKDPTIRLKAAGGFDRYFNKNVASEISKSLDDSDDAVFDAKASAVYSAIRNYWLNPWQIGSYIPKISISGKSALKIAAQLNKELAAESPNEVTLQKPLMILAAAGTTARPVEADLIRALHKIGQDSWSLRSILAEALGNLQNDEALNLFLKEYDGIQQQVMAGTAPDSLRLLLTQLARFEDDRVVDAVLPLLQSANPTYVFYGYLTLNYKNARNPKYLSALDQVRFRISSDISSSDENKRATAIQLARALEGSDLERIGKSVAYKSLIDPKRNIEDRLKSPELIVSVGAKGALNVFIAMTAKVFLDEKTLSDSDTYRKVIKSFPLDELEMNEIWFYANVLTPALSVPEGRAIAEAYFDLMNQIPGNAIRSWWYPSVQTLVDAIDNALVSNSSAAMALAEYLIVHKFDQDLINKVLKPKLDDSESSKKLKRAIDDLKARYQIAARGPWGEIEN